MNSIWVYLQQEGIRLSLEFSVEASLAASQGTHFDPNLKLAQFGGGLGAIKGCGESTRCENLKKNKLLRPCGNDIQKTTQTV